MDFAVSVKEKEQIKKDLINLNSKLQLLKLTPKTVELQAPERELNKIKCNDCDFKFETENGLKVHFVFVHPSQFSKQNKLKSKYCVIRFSDSGVLKKKHGTGACLYITNSMKPFKKKTY